MSSTADVARRYIERGFAPIPIPAKSKKPNRRGWQNERWSAQAVPKGWNNGQNIGLLLGEPSGWLVDIDLDHRLAAKLAGRFLEPTRTSGRETSPDSHWWYVAEGAKTQTFRDTDQKKKLVELRSTGTQTVVEPSVHPSGERYAWNHESGLNIAKVDTNDLQYRVRLLATAALVAKYLPPLRDPKTDEGGGRHDYALPLVGFLLGSLMLAKVEALAVLKAAWDTTEWPNQQARKEAFRDLEGIVADTAQKLAAEEPVSGGPTLGEMVPGMPLTLAKYWNRSPSFLQEEEDGGPLGGSFANIASFANDKSPKKEEWEPPIPFYEFDLPAFPADALPDWAAEFVKAEAKCTQTPEDLAGCLLLDVGALTIAKIIEVERWPGWREPTNLYTAVVMPPGSRKSIVFKHATKPVHDFERKRTEEASAEIAEQETKRKVHEHRVGKLEAEAAKTKGDNFEALLAEAMQASRDLASIKVPEALRLLADDATPESLATLMSKQGGRIALMSPEGDAFDMMAGRYSQGVPNLGVYLKGHAGDPLRVDRAGRSPESVNAPAITIGLAVQPDVLHGLTERPGFRGRGLLGRFLYSLPPNNLGARDTGEPAPVPHEVQANYRKCVMEMLKLAAEPIPGEELEPCVLKLSDEAKNELARYMAWLEPQLGPDGELGAMTDWAGKLAGAAVRIAAILYVMELAGRASVHQPLEVPDGRYVPAAVMAQALRFAEYFLAHARAAFAEMGADPVVEGAKHILAWVERKGVSEFSKREAFEGTKGRFVKVSEMQPALELLVSHAHIRQKAPKPRGPKGGRPSERYEVSPLPEDKIARVAHSQNSQYSQKPVGVRTRTHSKGLYC